MGKKKRGAGRLTFQDSLIRASERLAKSKAVRPGDIVFRLAGEGGGSFVVECGEQGVRVAETAAAGADRAPVIEVIGEARIVEAILTGQKDAREQFLTGRFRVRGDLRYLSEIALELGYIKEPL